MSLGNCQTYQRYLDIQHALEEPDIPEIPDHLLPEQASGDMAQAVASPVVRKLGVFLEIFFISSPQVSISGHFSSSVRLFVNFSHF